MDDRFVSNPSFDSKRKMISRSQKGIFKPTPKYDLIALHASLNEPCDLKEALKHSCWVEAVHLEWEALDNNNIWKLVPRTSDMNVVGSKWVYKTKLRSDGSI